MAKRTASEWQLFIDESGSFDDPLDTALVAGLLVHAPSHPAQEQRLRQALQQVLPGVPYPPHASVLNTIGGRLACWVLDGALPPLLAGAWSRMRAESTMAAFVDPLLRGRLPEYSQLQAASGWLSRRQPAAYAELLHRIEEDSRQMHELCRQLPDGFGADCAFWIAAARVSGEEDPPPQDAYLEILSVLFERVFALLRCEASTESQRVWVLAATRRVQAPIRLPLTLSALAGAVDRAARFPFLPARGPGDDRVRIVPQTMPPRYDARVHPGLVFADYASNRLRRVLLATSHRHGWDHLAGSAMRSLALPVEAAARAFSIPLPTVAASGPARAAIEAAFTGRTGEAVALLETATQRWAKEQAARWVGVAPGTGRGQA